MRNHYVQRGYLEQWEDANGRLVVGDLKNGRSHPNNTPGSIFREEHLYFPEMEDLFTKIEGDTAHVLRKIAQGLKIEEDDRMTLSTYIAAQRVRTKGAEEVSHDLLLGHTMNIINAKVLDKRKLQDYKNSLGFSDLSDEDFIKALQESGVKYATENKRDNWHEQILKLIPYIRGQYYYADWQILRCGSDSDFITSDNPVSTIGYASGKSGLIHPTEISYYEHTFPISPKTFLIMRIRPNVRTYGFSDNGKMASKTLVKMMNRKTVKDAHRFVVGKSVGHVGALMEDYGGLWSNSKISSKVTPDTIGKVVQVSYLGDKI